MPVDWDPKKASANYAKHGVRFSDAEGALLDSMAMTREDRSATGEARYVTIGQGFAGQLVVVVYSHRGEHLRLISARRSSRGERNEYEEGI